MLPSPRACFVDFRRIQFHPSASPTGGHVYRSFEIWPGLYESIVFPASKAKQ